MPRLERKLTLLPDGPFYKAYFPHTEELKRALKTIPGCCAVYDVNNIFQHWRFPQNTLEAVERVFAGTGLEANPPVGLKLWEVQPTSKEHNYQLEGAALGIRCAEEGAKGYLFAWEMGTGKTIGAIAAAHALHWAGRIGQILIVCPALVRENWRDELARWWPLHPPICVASTGEQLRAAVRARPSILITSYGLAQNLITWKEARRQSGEVEVIPHAAYQTDLVILDECHYIKNDQADRSKSINALRRFNPDAMFLGLSGTPITSEPTDLWHQLEVLTPGAWGDRYKFCDRYSGHNSNRHADKGYDWKGLSPTHGKELAKRLAHISNRVTKKEIAHLLPPFTVQGIRVRVGKTFNHQGLFENLSSGIRKQHELDKAVAEAGMSKVDHVVEAARIAMEQGQQVAILAWHKKTAKRIAKELAKGGRYDPVYVDGDIPVERRTAAIKSARANLQPLVATMASVNVGIDLTHWTTAIFGELYWQLSAMLQALGRFSRLSGLLPSLSQLIIAKGSLDEPIAYTLLRRLREQTSLFEAGQSEDGLLEGLEQKDEDFLADIRAAAASRVEEEAYL